MMTFQIYFVIKISLYEQEDTELEILRQFFPRQRISYEKYFSLFGYY